MIRPPLHPYQEFIRNFIYYTESCILMVGMGAGKTLGSLDALYYLNPNHPVLIIAPKNIAKLTWQEEIEKWGYPFSTTSLLVNDKGRDLSPKEREELYKTITAGVYFINREKIVELVNRFPYKKWPFKTVIIDESQGFKGYSSSRFKALKQIRPYINRTICLTGTPNPNGLEDLWSQVYLVDMGARLGTTITAFRETYFTPGRCAHGYPYEWIPRPGAKEEIFAKIRDIAISIEGVEHDKTIKTHIMQLTKEERKQYEQLKKTHVLYIKDDVVIDGQNAAILAGKLTQLAAGSIYTPVPEGEDPPAKRDYIAFHNHKLQKCVEIVNDTESPTLIAYAFQSDKERLLNTFGNRAKVFDGSAQMMQSWNQQLIEVLLIHPASAGHGLNFQYGGHTLIWYTLPWNMEHYLQTNARIARQGQTSPVAIHVLIIQNTIDERISAALTRKELDARELQKAVKVEFISQEDKAA